MAGFLVKYWLIIVFALGVACAWGTSTAQISAIGASNTAIVAKLDKLSTDVASALTSSVYTNRDIDDLRDRVSTIEASRR